MSWVVDRWKSSSTGSFKRISGKRYETEGGPALADRFFDEVEVAAARVIKNPKGYHFEVEGLRRVRLEKFPYHFLYRDHGFAVRFLVLRHDSRHPSHGLRRQ